VAAVVLPALNCLQRGQVSVLKIYLLMVGFRCWLQYRGAWGRLLAGNLLAMPIVLKIIPALPVGVWIGQQLVAGWRRAPRGPSLRASGAGVGGTLCGLAIGFFFVAALLVGWNSNWQHLHRWYTWVEQASQRKINDRFEGDMTSVRNQSLVNAARHLGNWAHFAFAGGPDDEGPEQYRKGGRGLFMESPNADLALLIARIVAALLLVAAACRSASAGDELAQAATFGIACVATLILSPVARVHYFVMLWPAALFLPAWLLDQGRRRAAIGFAVAPAALVIVYYLSMKITGRAGLLGLGITAWYSAACVLLAWRPAASQVAAETLPLTFVQEREQRSLAA
jgi:hypothetical protein